MLHLALSTLGEWGSALSLTTAAICHEQTAIEQGGADPRLAAQRIAGRLEHLQMLIDEAPNRVLMLRTAISMLDNDQ